MEETARQVLQRIDPQEVSDLALALGNIASPPGREAAVGEYLCEWLQKNGFAPRRVGMFADRFSVVATLPGSGDGQSLLFNSHMDTSKYLDDPWTTRNPADPIYHSAWTDGDYIVGEGVVNDKGPMAAFLVAAKAIRDAGAPLRGDLVLTMVPGEIGQEPVDEFPSPQYLSKEVGARYLVSRGVLADYVLVAEGTDFRLAWTGAGKAFFKVTVYGRTIYTPRQPARSEQAESPNAIVKMAAVIPALEAWADRYERENTMDTPGGRVVPKVNIGAIRGGTPQKIISSSAICSVYLDVRIAPGADPLAIRAELREVLADCGVEGTAELFAFRKAQVAEGVEPLVEAIGRTHAALGMEAPSMAVSGVTSMWRDHIPFIEAGIPALNYGPGSATGGPRLAMHRDDLLRAARAYACIALDICMRPKPRRAR